MTMASQHPWNVPVGPGENGAHFGHYKNGPDTSRPAYALVRLSFNPAGGSYLFEPGDRVDEILPADVLVACVKNGEVTYEKPGTVRE